ncbi:MAG: serine/threonine protein kinase [Deltaproteobacteria bacterium]|nr:serine/threonine protein kinase [Deltaproteobacteria bacterium]
MPDAAPDVTTQRALARVGSVLRGKWQLEKLLGVGGMASVYAATHRNGLRGAVKLLHAELAFDSEGRSRFLREGYVANKVDHPGAVKVLDDDVTEDGSVFLVMELLEGTSLESARSAQPDGRFEVQAAVRIVDSLLEVLEAAHDKGIVHRDLKPDNLFLTRSGQVKVLDFGIARLREGAESTHRTRTGTSMGTPAFMPPEQALGNWDQVDARTDLWAAGATLWNLLTNRMVHEANTVNKLLLAAMTQPVAPIRTVRPDIPDWLAAVIDRALCFEPKDRWQTAREFRQALRAGPAAVAAITPPAAVSFAAYPSVPVDPPTVVSFDNRTPEPHAIGSVTPLALDTLEPHAVRPARPQDVAPVAPIARWAPPPEVPVVPVGGAQTASPVSSDREPPTLRRGALSRRVLVAVGIGASCAAGLVVIAVLLLGKQSEPAPVSPLSSSSAAALPTPTQDAEANVDAGAPAAATDPGVKTPTSPSGSSTAKAAPSKTTDRHVPPKPGPIAPPPAKTRDPLDKY